MTIPWREKALLRVAEISEVTGLSQTCVRRMIRLGQLPHRKIGTRVLVPTDAVRALVGEISLGKGDSVANAGVSAHIERMADEILERFGERSR